MIAYKTTWLANLRLQETVKKDAAKGLITPAEYRAITDKYTVGFYTPHLFVRAGLFLLTCVIVLFSDGLLSLVFLSAGINSLAGWFIFLGVLTYGALELMVYNMRHYQSGVDDALLFIAAMQIGGGICSLIADSHQPDYISIAGVILLLSFILTLRFTNVLMSGVMAASFFAFVFYLWIRVIPAGLATAPFAIMFFSGGVYWLADKFRKQKEFVNYLNCLTVVQEVSLLGLYAAGNYFVIQNLGSQIAGTKGPVPFGMVFWLWTFAVPVVYIIRGLRKKDSILLRIGLLLIVATGFTFRNYYHLLPLDVMLTIIGVILLGVVFGLSRYLKTPKHGITTDEPDEANALDNLKVESLVAAGSFSHAPTAPTNTGVKFGGGSFGGGGSSGDF